MRGGPLDDVAAPGAPGTLTASVRARPVTVAGRRVFVQSKDALIFLIESPLLSGVVIEQPCVADVARQNLHRLVPADLLDLPHVGAGAGGRGHEARAQAVPGVARGVEPRRRGARLDDAGHGMVG